MGCCFENGEAVVAISSLIIFLTGLVCCLAVYVAGENLPHPYGRTYWPGWAGPDLSPRLAWFVQESPSFLIPFFVFCSSHSLSPDPPKLALLLFIIHYFQRTFVYPFLFKGGTPLSIVVVSGGFLFCLLNGFMQSYSLMCLRSNDIAFTLVSYLGVILWLSGFLINLHSDYILRNLRKPGEKNYKIPRGGFFEYVSCANFLGEITEWWGFTLVCTTYSTVAFAAFATMYLTSKASLSHKFYLEKFKNYPKTRKIVFPFIF